MDKTLNVLWLLLVILGVLFVILLDQGNGLDSPGIWLMPIGVLGVIISSIRNGKARRLKPLCVVWLFALFSILGLYYGWFTKSFGRIIWVLPAAGFTLLGIVLLFVEAFRNMKE